MARTQAQRSRVKRIEQKLADRKSISAEEREYRRAYKAGERLPDDAPPAATRPRFGDFGESITGSTPAPRDPSPASLPFEADGVPLGGSDAFGDDEPLTPDAIVGHPMPPVKRCTIPDCIACSGRDQVRPMICGITGREVWPPLDKLSGQLVAGGVFWLLGIVFKLAYDLAEVPEPTPLQVEDLGRVVVKVVQRRAGWLAEYDDYLMSVGALVSFHGTAKRAPKRQKKPSTAAPPREIEQ